ncbi:hypothetical protein [Streptomyces aureus]|uniref:hypothetical protein n=1 Tax=Streptomyces aureus TaxID=193461 RepID=UPI0006E19CC7|nr:hypothetical protein [Streptomyces aureus]
MTVTDERISTQISDLKQYLTKVDQGLLPTTDWMTQQLAPVNKLIEDLKAQQEKVAEEVVKAPWEQVMEQLGLGAVAEMIKKFNEEGLVAGLGATLVALGSVIVPILLVALSAFLVFQLQKWHAGRNNDQTIGQRPDGSWGRRSFTDIQNERNGVAPGGMADIPADANFDELRSQLERLNPHLAKFNLHAPSFVTNFRKMPTKGAEAKADVVVKIAEAVKDVDHQVMASVASGMGKINGAVKNANPRKTGKFAEAIGKLKLAMKDLDVDKVPKMATFQNAANAAKDLAQHTGTLSGRMGDFAQAVRELDRAMNGAPA